MYSAAILTVAAALLCGSVRGQASSCPDYTQYSNQTHGPFSSGRYQLSSQRPTTQCRSFVVKDVDDTIDKMRDTIKDPDLYQLFSNALPNTLDTTVKWRGHAANNSKEELAFIITGDINAMWFRDSANQLQSYVSFLKPDSSNSSTSLNSSTSSLASLYRGAINLQARYLQTSPYCQSFQPPPESGIAPSVNGAANGDMVKPPYDNTTVFECKFELDSFAAFLELSNNYWNKTQDATFFKSFQWESAVQTILNVADAMSVGTYSQNGSVNTSPYTFIRTTMTSADSQSNKGVGSPSQSGTGLVRSAFRPSDDNCIYQLFIPANAMFSHFLAETSEIAKAIGNDALAGKMSNMSSSIRSAILSTGLYNDPKYGTIYAFEVDGFGSVNSMDDANIPSLLSLPFLGFVAQDDPVYQATRKKILSADDPYYARGPVLEAVGGPHDGPGHGWPMAAIVRILTTEDDAEITAALKQIVSSTARLGLIHESVNAFDQNDFTRSWFAWANGLFGQMVLDLAERKPDIVSMSFQ